MYQRHIIGKQGEQEAVDYLKSKGYKIIERNFSCRQGELDIIATDEEYIVFIEIKTRTNIEYGLPSEAVTKRKLDHMLKTIKYYLYIHHLENANVRIDVIEVFLTNGYFSFNHLKQII